MHPSASKRLYRYALASGLVAALSPVAGHAAIAFSTGSQSVLETAGAATLSLVRSGAATEAASVRILITHGTATAGEDFSGGETVVNWAAGETGERTVSVSVFSDTLAEGTETTYFALTDVTGDTLGAPNTQQFIITDAGGTVAEDAGLNEEQRDVGEVLDTVCAGADQSGDPALQNSCETFLQLTNEQQQETVESILPRHVAQQAGTAAIAQTGNSRAIQQRMQNVRTGTAGNNDVSGLQLEINGEWVPLQTMLASTDAPLADDTAGGGLLDERWGVFASGQIQMADQNSTAQELGYVSDAQQLTAGVDYRFTPTIFAGTALSITRSDAESNADGGDQQSDIVLLSAFGNYYLSDTLYLDGMLSVGSSRYDTTRMIVLGAARSPLTSDTDGSQTGLSLTLGYDRNNGPWQWGGYLRTEATRFAIDAYEEQGPSGFALGIGDQHSTSAQTALGGNASYVKAVSYGVWVPKLTLEWVHEFQDNERDIDAWFVNQPDAGRFVITTQEPDRDFFNVGWSVAGTFASGRSAYLRYEALLGRDDYVAELVEVGARLAF